MSDTLDRASEPFCDPTCPLKRTKYNIILSCLFTLLICAWTSVHPNIPARNGWLALSNRLRVMLWMIVAPELVLAWAVRQLFAAQEIQVKFNEGLRAMGNLASSPQFNEGITEVSNMASEPQYGLPPVDIGSSNDRISADLDVTAGSTAGWKKWTIVHGFFFDMGGFTIVDPSHKNDDPKDGGQNGQVLTFHEYETHFKQFDTFSLPTLTKDEIKDRSKAPGLTWFLAFLQLIWFLVQCIARRIQGLTLTELELVTAASAGLNYFTFVVWLNKPLDVKQPIRIYFATTTEPLSTVSTEDPQELTTTYVFLESWNLLKESASALYRPCLYVQEFFFYMFSILPLNIFYIVTFPVYVLFPSGIVLLLKVIEAKKGDDDDCPRIAARMLKTLQSWRYKLSLFIRKHFGKRFRNSFQNRGASFFWSWFLLFPTMFFLLLFFSALFLPFSLFVSFFSFAFHSIFSIISTSTVRPGASHVPTFYASKSKSDKYSRMVVFAFYGIIFNGINILGWKLAYPTSAQRTLWRVTSLVITTIPFIVAPIDCLLENVSLNGGYGKLARDGLDFIMTILLVIYVPVRLSLIAQAFVLLFDQPEKALLAVDWTKYIPHV